MLAQLILFAPLAIVVLMAVRQLRSGGVRDGRLDRAVREEIERHRAILRGKWLKAHDEYGTLDRERWLRDVDRFVGSAVLARTGRENMDERTRERLVRRAARRAEHVIREGDAAAEVVRGEDPLAFEHRCAEILRGAGWDARVSGGAGDQGADVIAEANGALMVVQCKRYKRAIGNEAVQEVIAARAFYAADMAAVVGTARYTRSAHNLADAADVMLLDEAGLAGLEPPEVMEFGR